MRPWGHKDLETTEWERLEIMKKIRDTKGTFHAKMGSIKDRNGMDLTEAEDIKNRCKNTKNNCTKKDLHDPDNHNGVITHQSQTSRKIKPGGLRKHHYKQS